MKLIPMTDYVHSEFDKHLQTLKGYTAFDYMIKVKNYANLLSTPLTLGMFVPCDLEGNVLEEPKRILYKDEDGYYDEVHWEINTKEYQQAKERVLFKEQKIKEVISGVYKMSNGLYFKPNGELLGREMTIEIISKFGLTLTPNAVKQYKI